MARRKPKKQSVFGATIVCDDVRKEINNKDILIGVYTGDILVPHFPVELGLSVWIEFIPAEIGNITIYIGLRFGGDERAVIEGRMEIAKLGTAAVAIPGIRARFDQEGPWYIEASLDGEEWITLKTKNIVLGKID